MKGELYHATTDDGWKLGVKRYRPKTQKQAPFPVVLCHGLAVNRYSVDFGIEGTKEWQQYSLAAFLSQGGSKKQTSFDVWVPELRGRGDSQTFDHWNHPERFVWSLDEYVEKDIPAVLSFIKQRYAKEKHPVKKVLWVGKSMGGMLAYAYGQTPAGRTAFKGCVIIASPVVFSHSKQYIRLLVRLLPRRIAGPVRVGDRLEENTMLAHLIQDVIVQKGNIEKRILDQYVRNGFADTISSKVINHFALCVRRNDFTKYPRRPWVYDILDTLGILDSYPWLKQRYAPYSYTDHLDKFNTPCLILAGKGDDLAHYEDVKYGFDHIGSKEKTFLLFGKHVKDSQGNIISSFDYGHLDINLGEKARDEVFPIIYDWLISHC